MNNYDTLINSIKSLIKQNGNQEITGTIMQNVLVSIISSVGSGATFKGVAIPDTNPGSPDEYAFYIAAAKGTYTGFNSTVITNRMAVFYNSNKVWKATYVDIPTLSYATNFNKKICWVYDSTPDSALESNGTNWIIPNGFKLFIPGSGIKSVSSAITVPIVPVSSIVSLMYDLNNDAFISVPYDSSNYNLEGYYYVATSVRNQMFIAAKYFKVNGTLMQQYSTLTDEIINAYLKAKMITQVFFYDVTAANCPQVNGYNYTLKAGSKFMYPKGVKSITSDIVVPVISPGGLCYLMYNATTDTFQTYTYDATLPTESYVVGYGVRNNYNFNANMYMANAVIYCNTVKQADIFTDNNNAIKNTVRFIDNTTQLTDNYKKIVTSLKFINIYSNSRQWRYYIIAIKQPETTNDMFIMYSFDYAGNRGQDIRIGTNNMTYVFGSMWYAKVTANNDIIELMFDHSTSYYFVDGTERNLVISQCRYFQYQQSGYNFGNRLFCSLGASTSTGAWLSSAAIRLNMNFKGFGVPGARWGCIYDDEVLDYSGAQNNNNNMMNQVARLFKENADTGYYPDVMTFLCGINSVDVMGAEDWKDAFVNTIDLSTLTPETWFSNAPQNYKKSFVISMRAVLEFISKKFPLTQLIIMTPQVVTVTSYDVDEKMTANQLGIAKRLSLPVIDFFSECGFNDITKTNEVFSNDGLHPNDVGTIVFTNYVEQQFRSKIAFRKNI